MKAETTYKYLPPALADRIHNLGLTVRRLVEGGRQGQHMSPHHGSSVEFSEYRNYVRGDPPSLIDWAVYARSDRYMIRRYREETNLRAYILLDTSESLAFREDGLHPKFDYACYLAAGLMYILVNQGDSVGLLTFGQSLQKLFMPTSTFEGLRPMLLHLEAIKPTGRTNIEHSLHQAAEIIRGRCLVIVISDLLQPPTEALRGLRHLQHDGHDVTVMHVLDGGELQLSFAGLAELRELETGEKMVVEADEIKAAYTREVEKYLQEVRQGCAECMADYHFVDTRLPIEEALHRRAARR